jgi:hypothetical protein
LKNNGQIKLEKQPIFENCETPLNIPTPTMLQAIKQKISTSPSVRVLFIFFK